MTSLIPMENVSLLHSLINHLAQQCILEFGLEQAELTDTF